MTATSAAPPDAALATEADAIAFMARRLAATDYPTGDHAALRRMDPSDPGGAAVPLYRLLTAARAPVGRRDTRWALVGHALALARGRHDPTTPTGAGLEHAGLSESRINTLLSADLDVLFDLLPRIARRLGAAGEDGRLDWRPLAALALHAPGRAEGCEGSFDDDERVRSARLQIARQYARAARAG